MADYPLVLPVLTDEVGTALQPLNAPDMPSWAAHISREVEAIAAELGLSPSAAFSTVTARFADIDSQLGALPGAYLPQSALDIDGTLAANSDAKIATQKAVKTYVTAVRDALLNGAGGAYDTLKELQDLIVADETAATALAALVALKANAANPVFTGTVTIPDGALAIADTSGLQTALDLKVSYAAAPTGVAATDTANLQAALDAAEATGGGTVYLRNPLVPYKAAGLDIGSRVKLAGPGKIIRPTSVLDDIITSKRWTTTGTVAASSTSLTVASATNIERGSVVGILAAAGRSTTQFTTITAGLGTGDSTIPVASTTRMETSGTIYLIVDNEIISYNGISGSTLQNVQRGRFGTAAATHSNGATIGYAEIHITTVASISGTTVTLNDAAAFGVTSATVTVGAVNPVIEGVEIDGAREAESLTSVSLSLIQFDTARAGRIHNCVLRGGDYSAIGIREGSRDCVVDGNDLRDCGEAGVLGAVVQLFRGCQRNRVTNNSVTGTCHIGIYIDDRTSTADAWDAACNDNIVEHNNIKIPNDSASNSGIAIAGLCTRNKIAFNTIDGVDIGVNVADSTQASITLGCDFNEILYNTIRNTTDGVFLTGDNNRVWGNQMLNVTDEIDDRGSNNDLHANGQIKPSKWLKRKSGDQSVNSAGTGTTLQNDTHLAFPVAADETWEFSLVIFYDGPQAGDFKWDFTVPAGATLVAGQVAMNNNATSIAATGRFDVYESAVGTARQAGTTGGTKATLIIRGIIRNGSTAGTVQWRWAQQTADATNTTVYTDSHLSAQMMAA